MLHWSCTALALCRYCTGTVLVMYACSTGPLLVPRWYCGGAHRHCASVRATNATPICHQCNTQTTATQCQISSKSRSWASFGPTGIHYHERDDFPFLLWARLGKSTGHFSGRTVCLGRRIMPAAQHATTGSLSLATDAHAQSAKALSSIWRSSAEAQQCPTRRCCVCRAPHLRALSSARTTAWAHALVAILGVPMLSRRPRTANGPTSGSAKRRLHCFLQCATYRCLA